MLLARLVQWAGIVCGAVTYAALALSAFLTVPAEDAVILWIYSRNLAVNGAISYVAHGARVEGATDFAWMMLVAGAIRLHIAPFLFTAAMNVCALVLMTVVLARCAKRKPSLAFGLMVAGAAGSMPQMFAAISGFATLADAVLLASTAYFCEREEVLPASFSSLVFCLFRPDAIVFVLPLLASLLYRDRSIARVRTMVLAFVLPGLGYEIWRTLYFHEIFPLPFLVKSDVHRIAGFFVATSVKSSLVYLGFTAIVIGFIWFFTRANFVGARLLPGLVLIPTCFYWCMRLDQNVGFRFFYYLPLSVAVVLALNWKALGAKRPTVTLIVTLAWLVLLLPPLRRELRTFRDLQSPDLIRIAQGLRSVPHSGILVSSEAGILPYDSEWSAVDPWGLNTPEFAHRFFQSGDIAVLRPSLIHTHPDVGEGCSLRPDWKVPYATRSWPALTRNIIGGVDLNQYDALQTSYGSEEYRRRKHWLYGEGDVACWFVRKGTVEHDAIMTVLREHHAVTLAKPTGS